MEFHHKEQGKLMFWGFKGVEDELSHQHYFSVFLAFCFYVCGCYVFFHYISSCFVRTNNVLRMFL
jgi:hypothetical protein